MHPISVLCVAVASLGLAGCGSSGRSSYSSPAMALPEQFAHATAQLPAVQDQAWWRALDDPQLEGWVELAIARNADLAMAAIRVRRAALEARVAGNALWPTPSVTLGSSKSYPLSGGARSTSSASSQVGLGWELDLFGRLGAQQDAARFEAEASQEDLDAVALSMLGSAANLYWQTAFANERIAHAQDSLAYAQRVQSLVALRYRSGAVSRLELREASHAVVQQRTVLSQLRQTRAELRQTSFVLFDGAPPSDAQMQRLPRTVLPAIRSGLPAELLGRRPDLRAAELRLRATLASSDAAAARIYPTLSLTGSLGASSQALRDIFANPIAALGLNLSLPILNARDIRLGAEIASSRHEEAVVGFRKAVYNALAEVEKALSARTHLMQQQDLLRLARDETRQIEQLYGMRYRAGQVPLRDWLDALERLRSRELDHVSSQLALLQNYLTIHQALGVSMARGAEDSAALSP